MVRAMHGVLYAAIIAAAAAIVGGIIGGAVPGYFMLKAEDRRYVHAMELERRAVIGTARALSEFFARVDTLNEVALKNGRWWGDELDRKVQPLWLTDQKAVLGQLTPEEAGLVLADHSAKPDIGLLACILEPAAAQSAPSSGRPPE
jgi:hypothetical protein